MANLAIAPVVNAKLYRHFAAATFAITLCVALFADGEAHQAIDDGLGDHRQTVKLKEAEAGKFGPKKIGDNRSGRGGGFGEDYDPSYGSAAGFGGTRARPPALDRPGPSAVAGAVSTGPVDVLTPDEMSLLTPAEQSAYLKRLRGQATPPREEEVHDLVAIEAGSRARSGGGGD